MANECVVFNCTTNSKMKTKTLCSTHYNSIRSEYMPICSVKDCNNKSNANGVCSMHYMRIYINGTIELPLPLPRKEKVLKGRPPAKGWTDKSKGYRYVRLPNHPIAPKSGKVRENRVVLYSIIGPGPHFCYWNCGRLLSWEDGTLEADHLDFDKGNNAPENLVASCRKCNGNRNKYHLKTMMTIMAQDRLE